MGFTNWIDDTRQNIVEAGHVGIRYSLQRMYWGLLRKFNPLYKSGKNVFRREWDLLILLDGCRTDAMEQVADDYEFVRNYNAIYSVGSTSTEWMDKTFINDFKDQISKTVYITANGHARRLNENDFLHLEKVYQWGWNEDLNTTPANSVTDAAIQYGRQFQTERERIIVHYMQPHFPSIPEPVGHGTKYNNAWSRLWSDDISEEKIWNSYIANLNYVLASVRRLLHNIDAEKTIISSDHGNAKGEYGVYEHPAGLPFQCLREVPWYKTTASDHNDYKPKLNKESSISSDSEIDDQLKALGYTV